MRPRLPKFGHLRLLVKGDVLPKLYALLPRPFLRALFPLPQPLEATHAYRGFSVRGVLCGGGGWGRGGYI